MASRKPKAKAAAAPSVEFKPCYADWKWWGLSGPCSARATRNNMCEPHNERGPGWTREWADSAFDPGVRFSYIAHDTISPPWLGPGEYARPEYIPARPSEPGEMVRSLAPKPPEPDDDEPAF